MFEYSSRTIIVKDAAMPAIRRYCQYSYFCTSKDSKFEASVLVLLY
jgi:hypothetical protein